MKRTIYIICLCFLFNNWIQILYAQSVFPDSSNKKWSVELTCWNALKFGGYVQVGESEHTGDKLYLTHDLGMNNLIYPAIKISRRINNSSSFFTFSAGRFFFSGHHIINKNIFYNGALIKGADGVSINQTNFYRIKLSFEKSFRSSDGFYPDLITGLVYDALNFYANGTILPGYGQEQHEDFVTQSLPYPFVGARLRKSLSLKSSLALETSGTYIPRFKSFFNEGGPMSLHYATVDCGLHYWLQQKKFQLGAAFLWRLIKIYEYSAEDDPNDFFIHASGIQLSLKYDFLKLKMK